MAAHRTYRPASVETRHAARLRAVRAGGGRNKGRTLSLPIHYEVYLKL